MEQNARKQRVAVYCHFIVGSEDQPTGREAQKTYYTQEISKNPDWEMVGFYADPGIRGAARKNRAKFDKMIAACKRRDIDIIITRSASRFARNMADCMEIVRMLKFYGVGVIFEREGISTLTEFGEMYLSLFSNLVQKETEVTAQKHPGSFQCRYGCVHILG